MSEALIAEATVTCWLRIILNLNEAIVYVATAEGVDNLGLALDLAELVGRAQWADCLLEVFNVAWACEQAWIRGNSPRGIQAVSVPPQATCGARKNRPVLSGTCPTGVTQDGLVVLVDNLVKVKIFRLDGLLLPKIACQLTWRTESRGT
jgi:hypothetical protein